MVTYGLFHIFGFEVKRLVLYIIMFSMIVLHERVINHKAQGLNSASDIFSHMHVLFY